VIVKVAGDGTKEASVPVINFSARDPRQLIHVTAKMSAAFFATWAKGRLFPSG